MPGLASDTNPNAEQTMSHRRAQVESNLKRAISQILARKASDPRIRGLVSVTRVDLSPNFKEATVFVTVIPEQYVSRTIHGLNSGRGMFQSHLAKSVVMKTTPRLQFRHDEGMQKEASVFDDIQRGLNREGLSPSDVVHEDEQRGVASPETDAEPDAGADTTIHPSQSVDDATNPSAHSAENPLL